MIMGKVPKKIRVSPIHLQAYHELNFICNADIVIAYIKLRRRLYMLFTQTFSNMTLVAALLGLCGMAVIVARIAKSRLGYSWSYSPSRRRP